MKPVEMWAIYDKAGIWPKTIRVTRLECIQGYLGLGFDAGEECMNYYFSYHEKKHGLSVRRVTVAPSEGE